MLIHRLRRWGLISGERSKACKAIGLVVLETLQTFGDSPGKSFHIGDHGDFRFSFGDGRFFTTSADCVRECIKTDQGNCQPVQGAA